MTIQDITLHAHQTEMVEALSGSVKSMVEAATGLPIIILADTSRESIVRVVEEVRASIRMYGSAAITVERSMIGETIPKDIVDAFRVRNLTQETVIVGPRSVYADSYGERPYKTPRRKAQWKDENYGRSFRKLK